MTEIERFEMVAKDAGFDFTKFPCSNIFKDIPTRAAWWAWQAAKQDGAPLDVMAIPEHKLLWIAKSFLQRIPEIVVSKDQGGNIECNVDNLQLITAMGTALMHLNVEQSS